MLLLWLIILLVIVLLLSNDNYKKGYTGASNSGSVKVRCYYCQRFHGPICPDKLHGLPATPIPPRPPAPRGDCTSKKKGRKSHGKI